MTDQHTSPDATHRAGVDRIARALARVRSRARSLLVTRRLSIVIASIIGAVVVLALLDYLVRMPAGLRLILWVGGLAATAWCTRRFVLPAVQFRPSLTEVALRLERSAPGRAAGLEGVLTSGLELAQAESDSRPAPPATAWLSARVIDSALERFQTVRATAILVPTEARRGLILLGAMLIAVTTFAVVRPDLTLIGAARILAPWSDAAWPRRTAIADITDIRVHPLGTALPLRAALTRTDQPPGETTVAARYRLITDGQPGPVRRVLLTSQRRPADIPASGDQPARSGELFERLVEPAGGGTALQSRSAPMAHTLEYWFETADDRTDSAIVRLVEPPAVVAATAAVEPPAYAGGADARGVVAGEIDLGPGADERALLGPVLAGSRVDLTIHFNKPIPGPASGADDALQSWAHGTLGDPALASAIDASVIGGHTDRVILRLTPSESLRLPITATDEHGLTSTEQATYALEVVQDRAPTVSIVAPAEDEWVLPTAAITVTGEGRDDAGLRWVALERQLARPPPDSLAGAAEPVTNHAEFARTSPAGSLGSTPVPGESSPAPDAPAGPPVLQATATALLDLASLTTRDFTLSPGDEVWLTALAADTYEDAGGNRHEPTRSAVRRLRIISADQFVEQIRSHLAQVRETAKRLDDEQARVTENVQREGATPENLARQAAITERLAAQSRSIAELAGRAERNNLDDPTLAALLEQAESLSRSAARSSGRASDAMTTGREPDPALTGEEEAEARERQNAVRDELGRLIDLLDRGEDNWLARRDLQRLLDDQKALAEETRALTERTLGKTPQDLTPQERAALEAIAQRQLDLSDRAEEAIQDLLERSEELRDKDAIQAGAMEQAADRARRDAVPQKMQEASQNAEQNQGQQAQQNQQEAIESLENMLEDLDSAQRNRDETLRRVLASIVDSLRNLVRRQETELASLVRARENGAYDGLDQGMIRLNQNTLGVAGEVRNGMPELVAIAELVERAAEAQSRAIVALRDSPIDGAAAQDNEQASLERLREALAEAERQKNEADRRENERKRAELRKAYRALLEMQVSLRDETATYAGKELNRKQRVSVRRLGERQSGIRADLNNLREKTREIAEAGVFLLAHTRLDQATSAAAERLDRGEADNPALRHQQTAIRILQSLLESLDETRQQEDEFRENESDSGGGGGGGEPPPVIPDMAELLLLRSMQQEAADVTRDLDDAPDAAQDEIDAVGQLQRDLAEQGAALIERLQQPPSPQREQGSEPPQ